MQRVPAASRYAIYPLGRYTRACVDDLPPGFLHRDARFVGFIDDDPACATYSGKPVLSLEDANSQWAMGAIILTRDTPEQLLRSRISQLQRKGELRQTEIIDLPTACLPAMLAHLGTYHPACCYPTEFLQACRKQDLLTMARWPAESLLVCTMDAELHPSATSGDALEFAKRVDSLARLFSDQGFSFSFCVQLHDSPGISLRTPSHAIERAIHHLGRDCVELHGLDHAIPVEGYESHWFQEAITRLQDQYGTCVGYWAAPGWNLNWRTLQTLRNFPHIQAIRGVWSGPNRRQSQIRETFRFPYRVGHLWQIPYSYVDWMFMDIHGTSLDDSDIIPRHAQLADFASATPCLMESIFHPFRLLGATADRCLRVVSATLDGYAQRGVRLISAAEALRKVREHDASRQPCQPVGVQADFD